MHSSLYTKRKRGGGGRRLCFTYLFSVSVLFCTPHRRGEGGWTLRTCPQKNILTPSPLMQGGKKFCLTYSRAPGQKKHCKITDISKLKRGYAKYQDNTICRYNKLFFPFVETMRIQTFNLDICQRTFFLPNVQGKLLNSKGKKLPWI